MKLKYRIWNEAEQRYLKPDEATVTADGKIVGWDGAKDDCVVEVCSNYMDVDGVEAFEGDVVNTSFGRGVVYWDKNEFLFRLRPAAGNNYGVFITNIIAALEIIGNIREGVK